LPRKTVVHPDAILDTKDLEKTSPLELRLADLRSRHPDVSPATGRPFGISAEQRIVLCEALRAGNYRKTACQVAGISYATFNNWMKKGGDGEDGERIDFDEPYRSFVDDVHTAEAEGEVELLGLIRSAAQADWKAATWILSKKNKEHWADADRNNIQVGTSGGVTIVLPSNNRELDKGKEA